MGKILTGFDVSAAKSKRRDSEGDEPIQESMRGSRTVMSNPSTDQKRVRRSLTRKANATGLEVEAELLVEDDLWSTAEALDFGPVVAWNPFKKDEPAADPMTCKVCGKTKTWDMGDERNNCPDEFTAAHEEKAKAKTSSFEIDYREAAAALDDDVRSMSAVSYTEDDDKYDNTSSQFDNKYDEDGKKKESSQKTAFMTDFEHARKDADALNGYGVALTYNSDAGMHTTVGLLSYDGNTCTVHSNYGRSVTVPISQVLGIDETTSDDYPRREFDAGPEGNFNFAAPIFNGLFPSGATAASDDEDWDPEKEYAQRAADEEKRNFPDKGQDVWVPGVGFVNSGDPKKKEAADGSWPLGGDTKDDETSEFPWPLGGEDRDDETEEYPWPLGGESAVETYAAGKGGSKQSALETLTSIIDENENMRNL